MTKVRYNGISYNIEFSVHAAIRSIDREVFRNGSPSNDIVLAIQALSGLKNEEKFIIINRSDIRATVGSVSDDLDGVKTITVITVMEQRRKLNFSDDIKRVIVMNNDRIIKAKDKF